MRIYSNFSLFACASLLVLGASATPTTSNQPLEESAPAATQIEQTPREQAIQKSAEIVINSLDEGLLTAGKSSSERHHYDQQAEIGADKSPPVSVRADVGVSKPEPRNQYEQQHPEPVIIDHRPVGSELSLVSAGHEFGQAASTTQAPQLSPQSNVATYSQTMAQPQFAGVQVQSQQSQQPVASSPNGWYPAQQVPYGQQQQQQQSRSMQGGAMATAASNQLVSVQPPTSINSIINSDYQSNQQMQPMQSAGSVLVNQQQQQQPMSNGQSTMSVINGQPVMMSGLNGFNNGRRISISNWLRGLSSMLANIFNRREHQFVGHPGSWYSPAMGANNGHWLSQAQSAIQQQQYQQYASNPQQQMIGSASSNKYSFAAPPQQQQQQIQPTNLQPVSQVVSGQAQPVNYQSGDLQASASSSSYVAVAPPSNQMQTQPQPQTQSQAQQQPQAQPQQQQVAQYAPLGASAPSTNPQARNGGPQSTRQAATSGIPQTQSAITQPWSTQISSTQIQPLKLANQPAEQNLPLAHYSRYATSSHD